ncbi:hypothetical protein A2U01_0093546, partial [Trifolium medium]|nr:hypothetical protein [Trifolium medium]
MNTSENAAKISEVDPAGSQQDPGGVRFTILRERWCEQKRLQGINFE